MGRLSRPRPICERDDTDSFDCGNDALNTWFSRHAWQNQRNDSSRTSIVKDVSNDAVAGFVSLSSGGIQRELLPKSVQRNRPDPVPIVLLGQLAVDIRYQRLGCARSLVYFALTTALRYSADIGCVGVLTQPIDEHARSFYAAFNFVTLPFDPKRRMIIRTADLKLIGLDKL